LPPAPPPRQLRHCQQHHVAIYILNQIDRWKVWCSAPGIQKYSHQRTKKNCRDSSEKSTKKCGRSKSIAFAVVRRPSRTLHLTKMCSCAVMQAAMLCIFRCFSKNNEKYLIVVSWAFIRYSYNHRCYPFNINNFSEVIVHFVGFSRRWMNPSWHAHKATRK